MKSTLAATLDRVGDFFMGNSKIHTAMARIVAALDELQIPFAVAGALAANAHGHVRTTEDVDILITRDGLARFKERWLGRGWVECSPGSRGLRDTVAGVDIDFLLAGDFPGDGTPKPVTSPDPAVAVERDRDGRPILSLVWLITLKLASGMSLAHRLKDLADVIELIRRNELSRAYGESLPQVVRGKYAEMWDAAQGVDPV